MRSHRRAIQRWQKCKHGTEQKSIAHRTSNWLEFPSSCILSKNVGPVPSNTWLQLPARTPDPYVLVGLIRTHLLRSGSSLGQRPPTVYGNAPSRLTCFDTRVTPANLADAPASILASVIAALPLLMMANHISISSGPSKLCGRLAASLRPNIAIPNSHSTAAEEADVGPATNFDATSAPKAGQRRLR